MPLLWRYLLSHFLKVFFLCVVAFVIILLTMRLEEIAYFATLGPQALHVVWFALQQIPYIIPIAIPISALISSTLLVQNLSKAHELTAMRSCGFSLRDIFAPILIAALFLSALNFYIVSELSTTSHLNAGQLKNQLRSINPLILLHNKHLMRMRGLYFDTLGPSRVGEFAQDALFFSPGKHDTRLHMMTAKQLQANSELFVGSNVTLVTSRSSDPHASKETLLVENMRESKATLQDFSQLLEKKIWTINHDHLTLPQLLIRLDDARQEYFSTQQKPSEKGKTKEARYHVNQILSEILRRFSVALAVMSFTFMGLAFGTSISRNKSNKGLILVALLSAFFLIAFFVAKSFDHALFLAASLYLLPHLIICGASLWTLRRIAHGVE